jgi:drug/metabolite transporter (DMT)-like permease
LVLVLVRTKALLVRGLVGCGGIIGVLVAASRLPLAVTSLLSFLAPPLTALCAVAVVNEPIPRIVLAGFLPSLLGVILILQPWASFGGLDSIGVAAAVLSPICIGVAGVLVRKLASGGKPEHPQV